VIFAARKPGSIEIKTYRTSTDEQAKDKKVQLLSSDPDMQIFSIVPMGRDFLLKRERIVPGSEVYDTELRDAQFEVEA
jgi:hypothetical protein